MTRIYLGLGSNIDRENSIRGGVDALKSLYGELQISPVYESKAYGFDGDDFFNLVVGFDSDIDINELEIQLKNIESESGRKKSDLSYCSRTLDIDLLLFGDLVSHAHELPRVDIVQYAFVLKPLCDLAPNLLHPLENKTMNELWDKFNAADQVINQIPSLFNS